MKMWLRLALFIAAIFAVVEGAQVFVAVVRGEVPTTPTNFWGSPFEWSTVVFNVAVGGASTGAMTALFLVMTNWKWPRTLDRWLATLIQSN